MKTMEYAYIDGYLSIKIYANICYFITTSKYGESLVFRCRAAAMPT